ncbi:MAG: glycosyltransferase family 39 protein [Anaerolineaceae bacterium]|nr:glycosyltransferase family 39 protein [Anaerolineaceae bacterium]
MVEKMDAGPDRAPRNEVTIQQGEGHVRMRVDAPDNVQLSIDVKITVGAGDAGTVRRFVYGAPMASASPLDRAWNTIRERAHLTPTSAAFFFVAALFVYLTTRLIALPAYPIYFFTDEAVQTTLAADLVRDHYRVGSELLPTFFRNAYQYNLGTSVYLQVIPYLLFGESIWVTRGVAVFAGLIAAFSVGLAMKEVFQSAYPWAAILLLSITPAWFLHSRTAFETAIATTFYAGFLYTYLLYRTKKLQALYPAVIFGALCFYSYSPARMVILLNAALFFLTDIRYHWQQRKVVLRALGLVVLMALPFLRFQLNHPQENLRHLEVLNSYWIRATPLTEKLGIYFREYLRGLNPFYWYLEVNGDMPRHLMKGYGHLLRTTLPFGMIGVAIVLQKSRQASYRILLLALLAAPSGGALVQVGITRALIFVIPAALVTALGLEAVLAWIKRRWQKISQLVLALPVFALLAGFNFWMLRDALVNGPFWHTDYGLGGMQWGAQQLFENIREISEQEPEVKLSLSPSWANGTDTIARFFFPGSPPFQIESIEGYFDHRRTLDSSRVFIMIPEEYEKVIHNPKFTHVQVDQILNYPNGQPGFYFVRLAYSAEFDAILEKESAQRRVLQEAGVNIDGSPAKVKFSYLDMGPIDNLFDNDVLTLVRTFEANPLKVEISFDQPRTIAEISARIGGTATDFSFQLLDSAGKVIYQDRRNVEETPDPRWLKFNLEPPQACAQVWVEVKSPRDQEPAHVHLWEITFK